MALRLSGSNEQASSEPASSPAPGLYAPQPPEAEPAGRVPTPRPAGLPAGAPDRAPSREPVVVLGVLDADAGRHVERQAVDMVRCADPRRFRVGVCVVGRPRPALEAELTSYGAVVYACRRGPALCADLLRVLRAVRPAVVHAHLTGPSVAALGLARAVGVPRRVLHIDGEPPRGRLGHRPGGPASGSGPSLALARRGRVATDVLAVSETAMRGLWSTEWRLDPRCGVIYKGLEPEPYGVAIAARRRGLDIAAEFDLTEPVTLLHVSARGTDTGREQAVAVLAAVRNRGSDAVLSLVGPRGPDDDRRVLAAAAACGVGEYVELMGERSDVPRLAVAASLLLVTAVGPHQLPTVVLEACAVGTSVLAPEAPGIAEIARLLPGVTMLPASAPDGVWADRARELTAETPTLDDRREALRAFCRSPFTVDAWYGALSAVSTPA